MGNQNSFVGKDFAAGLDAQEDILPVAHALASRTRLLILRQIGSVGCNINEIAQRLELPLSTFALNVKVLEEAGVVYTDVQPGARGQMKVCYRRLDTARFDLRMPQRDGATQQQIEIPVGCYQRVGGIRPTCGWADARQASVMDDIAAFYEPGHFAAQILWMREGFVEYHLPVRRVNGGTLSQLEISFEACAEAPGHRNNWPSDLFVAINGQRLGVWHCPGDFGGRRGQYNPDWWAEYNTQYGHLKTWLVNEKGTWLEKELISGTTLESLHIAKRDHIALRIGVEKIGDHPGGMNLFGRGFGDFDQAIIVRYGFSTQYQE